MPGLAAEGRVLLQLLRGLSGPGGHAARLSRFYGPQAGEYDRFRERLLHGRRDLIERLDPAPGAHVVELGGGTGRNLDFLGDRLPRLASVTLVDLCRPLLAVASARAAAHDNIHLVEADATRFQPDQPVDCVYFSYALTMIPDWRGAIDNALAMLKPGGTLGVVDFHISAAHGWFTRAFWPRWFAHDGVRLSPQHLPYLRERSTRIFLETARGPVPYLGGLRVPYYVFVGRKHDSSPG